jgi:hypothetical protein
MATTKMEPANDFVPASEINFDRPANDSLTGAVLLITGNQSPFNHLLVMDRRGEHWFPGNSIVHAYKTADYENWLEHVLLHSDEHTNFYVLEKGGYRELNKFDFGRRAAPSFRYLLFPSVRGVHRFYVRFDAATLGFLLNLRDRVRNLKAQKIYAGLDTLTFNANGSGRDRKTVSDPNHFVIGSLPDAYEGNLQSIGGGKLKISEAIPFLDTRLAPTGEKESMPKIRRDLRIETDGSGFLFQYLGGYSEPVDFSEIEALWRKLMDEDDFPTYAARLAADNALQKSIRSLNRIDEKKEIVRESIFRQPERLNLFVKIWSVAGKKRIEGVLRRISEKEGAQPEIIHTYAFKYNRSSDLVMDVQNHFTSIRD